MGLHYSPWATPPNGGAKYRLNLTVFTVSQDPAANATILGYELWLEKDRSYNGFYAYSSSYSVTINGSVVASASGAIPNAAWTKTSRWLISTRRDLVIPHNPDGTYAVNVAAHFNSANSGWSIGSIDVPTQAVPLPALSASRGMSVTPSTATVGSVVDILLTTGAIGATCDVTWVSGNLSGTIDTNVSIATQWTVADVMGEFPGKVYAPVLLRATTKIAGVPQPNPKEVLLLVKAPPPPPAAPTTISPAKQFDLRARLVVADGSSTWEAVRTVQTNEISMTTPHSATATCTIKLSKKVAVDFPDFSIVEVDVFNGTDWITTDHRFVLTRVESDDADTTQTVTYSGIEFVDYLLQHAYSQVDLMWDGEPNHAAPTTPGEIMRYTIAQAKARGWGIRFQIDFNGSVTSLGDPWINGAVNRTYNAGIPLSQILSGLVEDGLLEYRADYHDDMAWLVLMNPGTGVDWTAENADPVVNLSTVRLSRAPRRASNEDVLTRVTVKGDEAVQITREKAADTSVYGQLEGWVQASGVKDNAAAAAVGDNALRDATITNERSFQIEFATATSQLQPFNIYWPGDWILIPEGENTKRDRIANIVIDRKRDAKTITITTGDRILSGVAGLAKRQAAQTGSSISGGNGTSLSPIDGRIPNDPTLVSESSLGYWNLDGAARSSITITWAEVTTAISGTGIEVGTYELWTRTPGIGAEFTLAGTTSDVTITVGDFDPLKSVEYRVRAQSSAGIFGEFSPNDTVTTLAPAVDIDGPDLADLYTDGVGSIYAVWGGTLDGDPAPARLSYVVAEVSETPFSSYAQMGTPIVAAGQIVINPGHYGTFRVRLRGFDRLGNAGTVSAYQEITTTDPGIDPAIPLPPTSLAGTAGAGWDASGFNPTAWFNLTWTAPTLDTDGDPITIAGYDIWGRSFSESVMRYITSSDTTNVRVQVDNGDSWFFEVRATSNFGGVSAFTSPLSVTANATIPAATAPAAPVLDQYAGLLRIKWSGGGMMPQIKYVYATISSTLTGTYSRAGAPLNGAGEVVVPGLAPGTYYAKIVMVDELGTTSTSAASGPITLLPITGVTIQTSPIPNTGIKITTGSLTSYDASGNPTFVLNAATGEVWIAPYDAVFDLGATGTVATTGSATTGIAISSQNSSFNTFIHPSGVQIRNDQTALSWWEADASDAGLVNFVSPRASVTTRLRVGDYEFLKEAKPVGSRLVIRYKGA